MEDFKEFVENHPLTKDEASVVYEFVKDLKDEMGWPPVSGMTADNSGFDVILDLIVTYYE